MRYEIAVDIEAPAHEVWAVLHDVGHWADWSPTVDEVQLLDDGPFGVGSRARLTQPKMQPMVWQVTEEQDGRSFVWRAKSRGLTMIAGHYVEGNGAGPSHVRLTIDIGGPLAPIAALAGKRVRSYVDAEGASLKRRCEDQPA